MHNNCVRLNSTSSMCMHRGWADKHRMSVARCFVILRNYYRVGVG